MLWFRGSRFAYNERFMQVSNGGFARETINFAQKMDSVTKTNPFNAMPAPLRSTRACSRGWRHTIRLIDAREDDARAAYRLGSSPTEM